MNENNDENAELWNQLNNAVTLICKQDQIVWAVFGVFWAANAVLLVALFPSGNFPESLIVSLVGFALCVIWAVIEVRAVAWLSYYEGIMKELEENYLKIPKAVSFFGHPEKVEGRKVRTLMVSCPRYFAYLWAFAVVWFLVRG